MLKPNIYFYVFLSWIGYCCASPAPSALAPVITLLAIFPAVPMVWTRRLRPPKRKLYTSTTMRYHYFEDVDWVMHPSANKQRNDCPGQYIRCIRRTTPLIPVCGYNMFTLYYEDYYSNCEIELENCMYRVSIKKGVYGGEWWQNKIYHNGEAYDCIYYHRRASSPEELEFLYFSGNKDEVLKSWNKASIAAYNNPTETYYDEFLNVD